jgi:hypothetical protein
MHFKPLNKQCQPCYTVKNYFSFVIPLKVVVTVMIPWFV